MGKEGTELGVELSELWLCGRSFLPSAAKAVVAANASVAATAGDGSAFDRTGTVPGTPGIQGTVRGRVFPVWDQLRDEFQTVLAQSADNLYACGDALVRVADAYAATDAAAAAEMRRLQGRYANGGEFYLEDETNRPTVQYPE